MRWRDDHAVLIRLVSIEVLVGVACLFFPGSLPALSIVAAYAIFILTRPRMLRTFRRMRRKRMDKGSRYIN